MANLNIHDALALGYTYERAKNDGQLFRDAVHVKEMFELRTAANQLVFESSLDTSHTNKFAVADSLTGIFKAHSTKTTAFDELRVVDNMSNISAVLTGKPSGRKEKGFLLGNWFSADTKDETMPSFDAAFEANYGKTEEYGDSSVREYIPGYGYIRGIRFGQPDHYKTLFKIGIEEQEIAATEHLAIEAEAKKERIATELIETKRIAAERILAERKANYETKQERKRVHALADENMEREDEGMFGVLGMLFAPVPIVDEDDEFVDVEDEFAPIIEPPIIELPIIEPPILPAPLVLIGTDEAKLNDLSDRWGVLDTLFKAAPTEDKDRLRAEREQVADERDALVAKMGGGGLTPEIDTDAIGEKINQLELEADEARLALRTAAVDEKPALFKFINDTVSEIYKLTEQLK